MKTCLARQCGSDGVKATRTWIWKDSVCNYNQNNKSKIEHIYAWGERYAQEGQEKCHPLPHRKQILK